MSDYIFREGGLTRRQTMQWVLAVAASPLTVGTASGNMAGPSGLGYGTDPDLLDPPAEPWPLTLDASRRRAVAGFIDRILPAQGELPAATSMGLVEFFDEWLSAPYPAQRQDRVLLLPLLDQLIDDARFEELEQGEAWERLRILAAAAYFTTPSGMQELGFIGNVPRPDFKGPPKEALKLLDARYDALDSREST